MEEDINGNGTVDPIQTIPIRTAMDSTMVLKSVLETIPILPQPPTHSIQTPTDGLGEEDADADGAVDQQKPIQTIQIPMAMESMMETESGVNLDADPTTTTDPLNVDTDGDGIEDGVEDANQDGNVDWTETDPNNVDTDNDGIEDGIEDANQDG